MAKTAGQAHSGEQSHGPSLLGIDDDGVTGLPVAEERDDAVVTRVRAGHDAVIAADDQRWSGHTTRMRTPSDSRRSVRCALLKLLDSAPVPTPSARDRFDLLEEHLPLLDREIAAHRVVVERPFATGHSHVESGQVAARRAAIADRFAHHRGA